MDDEGGVKAPVTRLRRRLSVEQSDDVKSSSAPSTPTKKRGGRRVAKPELDLIDENAPDTDTPKILTKKPNMKELEVEEKPVTPSRRSARIKSNTSIVLETTPAIDSPRAKRALRRNSQVGSDNEAPVTPARLTRRTRKDSTNTEKVEPQQNNKVTVPITEIIVEEPENSQKLANDTESPAVQSQSATPLRKSPRLSLKKGKSNDSIVLNEKEKNSSNLSQSANGEDSIPFIEKKINESEEHNNSNKENEIAQGTEIQDVSAIVKLVDISNNLADMENNKLSISNKDILNKLTTASKKKEKNLNKSSPALTDTQTQSLKYNRHRTKSWTGLSNSIENDNKFFSDSEDNIKKVSLNKSANANEEKALKNIKDNLKLSSNNKRKNVDDQSIKNVDNNSLNLSANEEKSSSCLQNSPVNTTNNNLFDKNPNDIKCSVFIEESDGNSEDADMQKQDNNKDPDDPIVKTSPKNDNVNNFFNQVNGEIVSVDKNDSCEPMEVDVTLPDNSISNKSVLKTTDMSESEISPNDKLGVSNNEEIKNQSRLSISTPQTFDKTANENKSTLVLSELKDISNENNVSQSQEIAKEETCNETLNFNQDNIVNKKNCSLDYLTSTPLQQKGLIKHDIQVNTSGIISSNTSKIDKSYSKINVSNTNKSIDKSEDLNSDDESSEENIFIDNEAEEASDDYESGDSRDEKEKRYEREHEIVHKGETLSSENESNLSNDTDYEKDSFVVSSNEKDEELLSGSGNDLSMSDNELKMTAKSKKKYNERKIKEQKKASKEMFESRHKLNVSNDSNKSNLHKIRKNRAIQDSSESEDESVKIKVKKNKRMRLNSSHETSINKSLEISTQNLLNKSSKSDHSKSFTNEVEMTIIEDNLKSESDPLSIDLKTEPKTPQKEKTNTSIQFIALEHSEKNTDRSQLDMSLADDPLDKSNSSDSSDTSNNVHIQNYDSVLSVLNKSMKTKKSKKGDISLNIDKKSKQKSIPIVDQLNLTQIKFKQKKQKEVVVENIEDSKNDKSKKSISNKESNHRDIDDESSASIDLRLLFSDDSKNSEDVTNKEKGEQTNDDSYIPLKTHFSHIINTPQSKNQSLTESAKKKKKKNKSLEKSSFENENSADESEVQFILDTTGTHSEPVDNLNVSAAKKKKDTQTIEHEDSNSDALRQQTDNELITNSSQVVTDKLKTPKSEKKKKKRESLTKEQIDTTINPDLEHNIEAKENQSGIADKSVNKSVSKTPKSEKKKLKRMSESQANQEDKILDSVNNEDVMNTSAAPNKSMTKTPTSTKKKKSEKIETYDTENPLDVEDDETRVNKSGVADKSMNKSISKTPKSEKKKTKKISESLIDNNSDLDAPMEVSNKSIMEAEKLEEFKTDSMALNRSVTKTPKSDKKRKKAESLSKELIDTVENQINIESDIETKLNQSDTANKSLNKSLPRTPNKKKAKKNSESRSEDQEVEQDSSAETNIVGNQNAIEQDAQDIEQQEKQEQSPINKSVIKTPKSEKKKKKIKESQAETQMRNETENRDLVGVLKRKRKSSLNQMEKQPEIEEPVRSSTSRPNTDMSIGTVNQSKKRKISHKHEESENDEVPVSQNSIIPTVEKQQNQDIKKQMPPLQSQANNIRDITDVFNSKRATKKRKAREDDEGNDMAKVQKVDAIKPVTRLPASILNQLQDRVVKKTQEVKRPKAISTTNFIVEGTKAKKLKPSNYLEESIYLNDEEVTDSKKQRHIKNPKVLPFLPTVSTSSSGYTTNFKVNILPKEIKFVARSTSSSNYKEDYLQNKKIKRLGTYELYKKNRNVKMSKF